MTHKEKKNLDQRNKMTLELKETTMAHEDVSTLQCTM